MSELNQLIALLNKFRNLPLDDRYAQSSEKLIKMISNITLDVNLLNELKQDRELLIERIKELENAEI